MSFDLDRALRWLKPAHKRSSLARREDFQLPWVHHHLAAGRPVLLDATVYIDTLQGRSPAALDTLITLRTCNHSAICLSELTHAFGRLKPHDPRTPRVLKVIRQTVRDIPAHRLTAPDTETWGIAGILAGLLFRLGGYAAGEERRCLHEALVYLHARKLGYPLVTGNLTDFDFLNQLVPDGRLLLYRKTSIQPGSAR